MFTLFQQKFTFRKGLQTVPYVDNEYYSTWLDNKHLFLSTRHKSWCILTDKEYRILQSGSIEQDPLQNGLAELEKVSIKPGNLTTFTTKSFAYKEEIIESAIEKGSFYFRPLSKIGRGLGLNELDVDTAFAFWKYLIERFINFSTQTGRIVVEHRASDMLKNLLHLENDYMCQRKPCGAGISMLSVNWNGDIVVCDMGRSQGQMLVVGNVAKDKYNDIILSDDIVGLRTITNESTPVCNTCAYGSYCGTCMANDSALMGNPIPRVTSSFDCQINLKMFHFLLLSLMDRTKRKILLQWTN